MKKDVTTFRQELVLCKGCPKIYFDIKFDKSKTHYGADIFFPKVTIQRSYSKWELLKYAIKNFFSRENI